MPRFTMMSNPLESRRRYTWYICSETVTCPSLHIKTNRPGIFPKKIMYYIDGFVFVLSSLSFFSDSRARTRSPLLNPGNTLSLTDISGVCEASLSWCSFESPFYLWIIKFICNRNATISLKSSNILFLTLYVRLIYTFRLDMSSSFVLGPNLIQCVCRGLYQCIIL